MNVGSDLDGKRKLTYIMFADDTTLFAASRLQLVRMIDDAKRLLAEHGLKLNAEKCAVQTTKQTSGLVSLHVGGEAIPVVAAHVGFKVLGTQFTLLGRTTSELRMRVSAA